MFSALWGDFTSLGLNSRTLYTVSTLPPCINVPPNTMQNTHPNADVALNYAEQRRWNHNKCLRRQLSPRRPHEKCIPTFYVWLLPLASRVVCPSVLTPCTRAGRWFRAGRISSARRSLPPLRQTRLYEDWSDLDRQLLGFIEDSV